MKVLIVCSGNNYRISPFISEQVWSLQKRAIHIDYYLIKGKGVFGYLKNLPKIKKKLKSRKYDLVHAMYGLSGMLVVLQKKCPVVITFLGSDINRKVVRIISKLAIKLSSYNIFVENKLAIIAKAKNKYSIISYGVDFENIFFPLNKQKCRKKLNLDPHIKLALFSSSFDRIEKNYPLAKKSAELVDGLKLIELRDYKRHEVNLLLNACDLLLMTSTMEGSPQVIKEAMACNCPIVTTDVGDVRDIIGNTEGCYITSYNPKDVASKIKKALEFRGKTKGREKVMHFDINIVTKKIINIYEKVISEYNKDHIKNQN